MQPDGVGELGVIADPFVMTSTDQDGVGLNEPATGPCRAGDDFMHVGLSSTFHSGHKIGGPTPVSISLHHPIDKQASLGKLCRSLL